MAIEDKLKEISTKLDNMSGGGSGGGLVVTESYVSGSSGNTKLDKTWQEIHDAITAGQMCWVAQVDRTEGISGLYRPASSIYTYNSQGSTSYTVLVDEVCYSAESATGTLVTDD